MQDRFEALMAALDNERQRLEAIKGLGALKDARAIPALTRILRQPKADHAMGYREHQAAAEALGLIGEAEAVPVLLLALEDGHASVRTAAARALGQIGDAGAAEGLRLLFPDRNAAIREEAARAYGILVLAHEVISAEPLLPLLADSEDAVRDAVMQILRDLGARAEAVLILGMRHVNSTVRGGVATLIGELKLEGAREALQKARYDDPSQWVRSRAEWALKQIPGAAWPSVRSNPDLPQQPKTLDIIRANAPKEWPSLRRNTPPAAPPPRDDSSTSIEPKSREQVQAMLDALDMRLANGEISEETYRRLAERWEKRLHPDD
ncbi:MAG: hypothetical protein OHK0046_12430 [Anaerolineae bacterium]